MNEAPVDAEMRTTVSNVFHDGRLPRGPVTNARILSGIVPWAEAAFRWSLPVKPDFARMISSILFDDAPGFWCAIFAIVNG